MRNRFSLRTLKKTEREKSRFARGCKMFDVSHVKFEYRTEPLGKKSERYNLSGFQVNV